MKHPNLKDYFQLGEVIQEKQPSFLDHLYVKMDKHIKNKGKVLLITLTKKSSEEITNFLVSKGYKAFYLHSEVSTLDRWEIIKKLKTGEIDIIVGINLLREGIDIPEVSLLAILDADKEGFLRSTTALIQIIGRAARNPKGEVVLYADEFTESIIKSLWETYRRRNIQEQYNKKNNITPKLAESNVKNLETVKTDEVLKQDFSGFTKGKVKKLKKMTKKEKEMISKNLKKQLDQAIKDWNFEQATYLRDQIKKIEQSD